MIETVHQTADIRPGGGQRYTISAASWWTV
jgi:hypothetical protein